MNYDISEKIKPSRGRRVDKLTAWIVLVVIIIAIVRIPYLGAFIDDFAMKLAFGLGRYLIYLALIYFCIMRIFDLKIHDFVKRRTTYAILFFIGIITLIGNIELSQWSIAHNDIGKYLGQFWTNFWNSTIIISQYNHGQGDFLGTAGGFVGAFWFSLINLIPKAGIWLAYIFSIILCIIGLSLVTTFKPIYLYVYIYKSIQYSIAKSKERKKQTQIAKEAKAKYPFVEQTIEIDPKKIAQEIKHDYGLEKPVFNPILSSDPYSKFNHEESNKNNKFKSKFSFTKKQQKNVEPQLDNASIEGENLRPYGFHKPVENYQEAYNDYDLSDDLKLTKLETTNTTKDDFSVQTKKDLVGLDYPKISIDELSDIEQNNIDKEKINEHVETQKEKLINLFADFDIPIDIVSHVVGATVIRYDFIIKKQGIKVSKILQMHDDIQLSLACRNVMIYAPVPNKSTIGIEVDNPYRRNVSLKEILQKLKNDTESALSLPLGENFNGNAISLKLETAPHVLVAGATGSGKSICINSFIASIILNCKPSEVRLLLIDPKRVELNIFSKLPHLMCPVITDSKKAALALKKIILEMDERFSLFAETHSRNIDIYNKKCAPYKQIPKIIVIVDELADLILTTGKEIEESITRITQLARAAGIHLIVATQRPSVDVITGLIKSNIPTRIAFSVSSLVDSRTILDASGAEKLLGRGDMLFLGYGQMEPQRIQGAIIFDDDLQYLISQTKQNKLTTPIYNHKFENLEEELKTNNSEHGFADGVNDSLYPECLNYVRQAKKASTSLLQRRFGIGFTRAARIIDALEANNIVSESKGSKPRDVIG